METSSKPVARPVIDPSAYVAPNAVIVGKVAIGPGTVISYGAILVADGGSITIGRNTVVMENSIIRSSNYNDCTIGNNVMVGPFCHLSGCHIEDEVFVATGVCVFNGAYVKTRSELRINSIVHVGTHLDTESTLPIGWIAVGNPAQSFPPDKHEEIWKLQKELNFPKNVFGVSRSSNSPDSLIKQMTDKYSRFLLNQRSQRKP
jgi:carbonic anhydrase/acetyltransferase-like protein (isoleucine patch superfamily)